MSPSSNPNSSALCTEEVELRAAVAHSPNDPVAHVALAAWLRRHSRVQDAAEYYKTALALQPNDSAIAVKLAATLIESKDFIESEKLLQNLVSVSPQPVGVFYELGKLRFLQGQHQEAISLLQRARQTEPDNAEYCTFLGHIHGALKNNTQAMALFQIAKQLEPAAAEPLRQMAMLIIEQKDDYKSRQQAEEYLRQACKLAPDNPTYHYEYGQLLLRCGRLSDAMARFELANDISPGFRLAIAGKIIALERLGDFKGAARLALDTLKCSASHPQIVLAFASVSRHIGEDSRAAEMLEELLTRSNHSKKLRTDMLFALGSLYDRLKRYPEAFHNFKQANMLLTHHYDRNREAFQFGIIIDAFPTSQHCMRARASNRSRLPVFIVGMPRSGTTLTEQIVASHPQVYGAGELQLIFNMIGNMHKQLGLAQPYPLCMATITRRQLDTLAQTYLKRLGNMARSMARVTDKMPVNFAHLGLIDRLFPGARVIHCRRDPLDNCVAIYTQKFTESHAYATTLYELGYYYRLYERLMSHWSKIIKIPVLEVRYEDLVAEPEHAIRKIIDFCDLPWDERCLRFNETKRKVNTLSYDQVRRPIYKHSSGRWRNYAPFLDPLYEGLGMSDPDADTPPVTTQS